MARREARCTSATVCVNYVGNQSDTARATGSACSARHPPPLGDGKREKDGRTPAPKQSNRGQHSVGYAFSIFSHTRDWNAATTSNVGEWFSERALLREEALSRKYSGSGNGGLLPLPRAGEGWGGGDLKDCILLRAPSLSLPRKRGRGRCGVSLVIRPQRVTARRSPS